MSDPANRAENARQRAEIATIRAGQDPDLFFEVEDTETPEPSEPRGVRTSTGQALASLEDVRDLQRTVKAQGAALRKQGQQLKKAAAATKAARRWMQQYEESFSEFHSKAKGYQGQLGGGLDAVAAALSGYMEGLNTGEVPANPTLLGIAKGMEALAAQNPEMGSFYSLVSVALKYTAYTNPLVSDVTILGTGSDIS